MRSWAEKSTLPSVETVIPVKRAISLPLLVTASPRPTGRRGWACTKPSRMRPASPALGSKTGVMDTVRRSPSRRSVRRAGVAPSHPAVSRPAQRWESISSESSRSDPVRPSTERILSPGRRMPVAGWWRWTRSTIAPLTGLPSCSRIAVSRIAAIRMFTTGPARMTTTRFHTGCRKYARSSCPGGSSSWGFMPLIFT